MLVVSPHHRELVGPLQQPKKLCMDNHVHKFFNQTHPLPRRHIVGLKPTLLMQASHKTQRATPLAVNSFLDAVEQLALCCPTGANSLSKREQRALKASQLLLLFHNLRIVLRRSQETVVPSRKKSVKKERDLHPLKSPKACFLG